MGVCMKLELIHVKENDKMILKNLLELYEKEPNDYEGKDVNGFYDNLFVYAGDRHGQRPSQTVLYL